MPRKSATSFEIVPIQEIQPRIEPPQNLSADEAALFRSIVQACSPIHFQRADAQLLACYVQSYFLTALAYESAMQSPKLVGDWERCARTMASLAGKLRLCPSARIGPKALGRAIAGTSYNAYPDQDAIVAARAGTTGRGWKARG